MPDREISTASPKESVMEIRSTKLHRFYFSKLSNPYLFYLFLCNFGILFVGMGLFPILPLYAGNFGASPATIGIYLALTYAAITAGSMTTSWMASRFTRKRVYVVMGLAGIPALVLMGQAQALWQVILLTAIIWFTGGVGLSLTNVYTGLFAAESSRGRSFGMLALAQPLGAVLGGLVIARVISWQGYPWMFVALAAVWSLWPFIAIFKIHDRVAISTATKNKATALVSLRSIGTFQLLAAAALLSALTISVGRLGLSLSMDAHDFSASAVSSANVVAGLVTLPLVFLMGTLSDRFGRKQMLMLSYLITAGSVLALIVAAQLWHFWLAAAMSVAAMTATRSLGPALATDLLSPSALDRGLPWINAVNWIAGIVGFAVSGYGMEVLGANSLYLLAAAVTGVAVLALSMICCERRAAGQGEFAWQCQTFYPSLDTQH